jgi:hypothetical protein
MSPSTDLRENRHFASELKFVVSRPMAEQIRVWARSRFSPDPHACDELGDGYQITSLYFDTQAFDVFHRRGSFGRSKYRIRRYGPSEEAFLERKLKTRGLVNKRRTVVRLEELERLTGAEADRGWKGYWYHQRLLARRLKPICQISYRRTARVATNAYGPIRLTLDDAVRALAVSGLSFNAGKEGKALSPDGIIIELKYCLEMPAVFKQLVEEFALNPQPISKYRLAAAALGYVTDSSPKTPGQGHSNTSLCLTF